MLPRSNHFNIGTKDAQRDYFLQPADLKQLPCDVVAFFGCGCSKYYSAADLQQAALKKHGSEGLRKKQEARCKRENNKRLREEQAEQAKVELGMVGTVPIGYSNHSDLKRKRVCVVDLTGEEAVPGQEKLDVPAPQNHTAPAQQKVVNPPINHVHDATLQQTVAALRKGLLTQTKKAMGFQMSGAPKSMKVEIPGVTQQTDGNMWAL
ncbi:hypothetical protein CYMTET_43000 [Cymbomonas tetramitiformis]|uniref:Uncharacterized protein n=1 Tax=Cymbomonas tetramitiformis TaxID=36881 RepID=A0AAE0C4D2_9CHLO|nr:hypothetical protein CYMTET_43000 [Cymbomonas tetramitiformis]|eukprot:gene9415-11151_t